jgi:DNA polymerase-3 subunit alpha
LGFEKGLFYDTLSQGGEMSEFVHLHNHTDYSLLDGAAPIGRYIKKAKEFGMTSLAMTDHGNMFGAIKFYNECKAAGINPIVGTEFYICPEGREIHDSSSKYFHLILLAMDDRGYHNLMELNSIAYLEGYYYKPRIDNDSLKAHNEGIICLSACLAGQLPQYLLRGMNDKAQETVDWYKEVFGDRYYIEIQDHNIPEEKQVLPLLVDLARRNNVKIVATNDIHYIEASDANAHDVLLCIGTGKKQEDEQRMRFQTQEFYFKSPDEMASLFSDYPDAISNTAEIASRCNLEIKFPGPLLPSFPIPEGFSTEAEYLQHLAHEGLKSRYAEITQTLSDRLEYELGIIIKMHFEGYFLIVRDYIYWAKQHDIPVGPGRGSGAGSLVAYCIDITDVEPMGYGLMFERFLNPQRISMPDFDIDFCFENRGRVIEHVTELYGRDRVSQIATFGTLKAKAVIKDVSRVLNISFAESNEICKYIPDEDPENPNAKDTPIARAIELSPELQEMKSRGGVYAELFDVAQRLQGLNRHISMHAAGVVIGHDVLTKYVPLYRDPKTGIVTTQYTMDVIEDCGLVKMDFLGLKTLTLIRNAERLVQKNNPSFNVHDIPIDDQDTYKMIGEGDTTCVFQFESPGMQKHLKALKPTKIEELVAMNALYRPGPMQFIPQYIDSKNHKIPIVYPDPELKGVLDETYGVIVYQEQVMQVAQIMAGYSLGEADILRKIMGKKKVEKLAAEKVKFVDRAVQMGRDRQHAEDIFTMLEPFGGYGFNKSHSVAYAIIAYQTAYLKAHYPAEFMAANLTNEATNPDKFGLYLSMTRNMGIQICPPSVNDSDKHFNVVDGKIIYGLSGIKGFGEAASDAVIKEREANGPYKDFMDFIRRADGRLMNSKALEALINTGTFDFTGVNRKTLLFNYPDAVKFVRDERESKESGQMSLFGMEEVSEGRFEMVPQEDYSFLEKLDLEKNLLGFYVSGHPLQTYQDAWNRCVHINLGDPSTIKEGKLTNVIGLVRDIKELTTKKNTKMAKLTVSDFNGTADLTVFTNVWETMSQVIKQDGIYGFRGKFSTFRDQLSMTVDNFFEDPNELLKQSMRDLYIEVNKKDCTQKTLGEISDILLQHEGQLTSHLVLVDESLDENAIRAEEDEGQEAVPQYKENRTSFSLGANFCVKFDDKLTDELDSCQAVRKSWFE